MGTLLFFFLEAPVYGYYVSYMDLPHWITFPETKLRPKNGWLGDVPFRMIHVKDSRSYHGGKIWSWNLLEICIYISYLYTVFIAFIIYILYYIYIYIFYPRHPNASSVQVFLNIGFSKGPKKSWQKVAGPGFLDVEGWIRINLLPRLRWEEFILSREFPGTPQKMVPLFFIRLPVRLPINFQLFMGMVWEASQKGVPFLGAPGNSLNLSTLLWSN